MVLRLSPAKYGKLLLKTLPKRIETGSGLTELLVAAGEQEDLRAIFASAAQATATGMRQGRRRSGESPPARLLLPGVTR